MMDLSISDHQCILFDTLLQAVPTTPLLCTTQFRVVAAHTADEFYFLFNQEKHNLSFNSDINNC